MGSGPQISQQQLYAAAKGDPDMLAVLTAIANTTTQQQATTGTTPVASALSGSPNPAAPVPPQASGVVSILGGAYVVQITNPGAKNPISQLQAAQAAGNASPLSPLQPVKAIFHQIRASTSPAFNVNSNTQTFGGNTGSAQVYWTITGLGSGTWFFQFRSTYDGVNFNQWKNANGGAALGGLINQVTTESAQASDWALFSLPGSMIAGIGEGFVVDQGIFGLPEQLFSSGMFAIAGPNSFPPQGDGVSGFTLCDVDLQEGAGPVAGTPDFPVQIQCEMIQASETSIHPSNASVFAIVVNPTSENVVFYNDPAGKAVWAVVKLPGGASIAIGQGTNLDQTDIYVPPALTWIDPSRMMSICSLTDAPIVPRPPLTGIGLAQLTGLQAEGCYLKDDGSLDNRGLQSVNWLAIAWIQGTDVQTVGGFPFLKINLQGGHAMFIGAGQVASGTPVALPAGCTQANLLSIATPAGSDNSGNHFRGVQQCSFSGLVPFLVYTDNSNTWSGLVNWMVGCWL